MANVVKSIKQLSEMVEKQGVQKAQEYVARTKDSGVIALKTVAQQSKPIIKPKSILTTKINPILKTPITSLGINKLSSAAKGTFNYKQRGAIANKALWGTGKFGVGWLTALPEGIAGLATTGIGAGASKIQSLWDKEGAKKTADFWKDVTKNTKFISNYLNDTIDETYGKYGNVKNPKTNTVGQVAEFIGGVTGPYGTLAAGQKAAQTATKTAKILNLGKKSTKLVAKTAEKIPFALQVAGDSSRQAINEGADIDKALDYGIKNAVSEGVIEALSGGIGGTTSNKLISKLGGKGIAAKIADLTLDVGGEGIEEVISTYVNPLIKRLSYDEKAKLATSKEALDNFVTGALTSIVLKGTNKAINFQLPKFNNTNNIQSEINQAIQDTKTIQNSVNNTNNIATSQPIKALQPILNQQAPAQTPTTQNKTVLPQLPTNIANQQNNKIIIPQENGITTTGQSSFAKNVQGSRMLDDTAKAILSKETDIKYYDKINNTDTLKQASEKLALGGQTEINRWNMMDVKNATAQDVAEGMVLIDNYIKQGDYQSMTQVAKKLRQMGTEAGQAVQAFSIMQRMTPEGMVYYAQSQLEDAYNDLVRSKGEQWVRKNIGDLQLTDTEINSILDKMQEVSNITDERQRVIKLAEINKIVTDKIPHKVGSSVKGYRRISMLLNPKTVIRNVLGNQIIAPINAIGDSTAGTLADKIIAKKTGVRTTGITNVKEYTKGMLKGAGEAFDDFRRGINTRDINTDKFEVGSYGKSFKDKGIGKVMNALDTLTNFTLDVGDRPFFKAEFMNSISNQMKLNNVTEPTADMIATATKVAEQRTWQDTNSYSKAVLGLRNSLNKLNIKGVGLGDVIIPFAKTPANLTKAIVDYSPAGVINAIVDNKKMKIALENGTFTPQLQKQLVDDLSKAFTGTMLYIIGFALAKAGITSGEADEDKDVAKFVKDTIGVQPYSIKIGDKTFTYDWAQPIASPLGIAANVVQNKEKDTNLAENIFNAISEGGNQLYEQSFLQSVKKLFSYEGPVQGAINTMATVPTSFIPTFTKQLNDIIDPIQRNTYVYKSPIKTSINQTIAKIPGLSQTLPAQKDVLGRTVKKYGGENNLFNVLLNPANVKTGNATKGAKEVWKVYQATGDKTIIPRVAANYLTYKNEKYTLDNKEQSNYQTGIGKYTSQELNKLVQSNDYKKLNNEQKSKVISNILSDAATLQKDKYLRTKDVNYKVDNTVKDSQRFIKNGLNSTAYYIYKSTINNLESDKDSSGKTITGSAMGKKAKSIMKLNISDKEKSQLLDLSTTADNPVTVEELNNVNKEEYQQYFAMAKAQRDKYQNLVKTGIDKSALIRFYDEIGDIEGKKDAKGKTISGSKKQAVFNYINSLPIKKVDKIILFASQGYAVKQYKQQLFDYINKQKITKSEKQAIWKSLGF